MTPTATWQATPCCAPRPTSSRTRCRPNTCSHAWAVKNSRCCAPIPRSRRPKRAPSAFAWPSPRTSRRSKKSGYRSPPAWASPNSKRVRKKSRKRSTAAPTKSCIKPKIPVETAFALESLSQQAWSSAAALSCLSASSPPVVLGLALLGLRAPDDDLTRHPLRSRLPPRAAYWDRLLRADRRSRLDAVTLLVFLAAAARAGIVATHARLGAANGRSLQLDTVDEEPLAAFFPEGRALAMVDLHLLQLVAGHELDRALLVGGAAAFGRQNLQAEPLRVFGPSLGVGAIDLAGRLRIVRRDHEVDIVRGVRAVARAHQLFRGLGLAFTAQDRTTAHFEGFTFSAGTRHYQPLFAIPERVSERPRLAPFARDRTELSSAAQALQQFRVNAAERAVRQQGQDAARDRVQRQVVEDGVHAGQRASGLATRIQVARQPPEVERLFGGKVRAAQWRE